MTLYEALCFFLIYSFIGWVTEIVYHAVTLGKIINRGFLNGPICPVYGFGMSAVLFVFKLIGSTNTIVIFLEGLILTSTIELIAGYILYTFFHARWWDYSKMPLNFKGYICPAFSIIWGLAVVGVVKIVHPAIKSITTNLIPKKILLPIIIVFLIVLILDTVVTALSLIGLNKKLKELDLISESLRDTSDRLTQKIGKRSIETARAAQTARVQAALAKAEIRDDITELEHKAERIKTSIISGKYFGTGRLLRAYPDAYHKDYKEIFKELQQRIKN